MTDEMIGHNSLDKRLLSFVERYEKVSDERTEINEVLKGILQELKSVGYDTKVFKKLIAQRKREREDIAEEETLLDLYRRSIGFEV